MADHRTQKPLAGIKVLELGRLFAAPFCAQLLGDLGAEVIKVERAGVGDGFRHYGPPFLHDESGRVLAHSASSLAVNRNKRSITVDFADEDGRRIIRQLAKNSDVFIENYRTGTLAKFGLDSESIRAINPEIVYLSVTGFGQTGPYATRPGTDGVFQAMSGLMGITGQPDGPPEKSGVVIADFVTGLFGALAVLAGLYERKTNGAGGQAIDLALLDSAISATSHRAMEYLLTGVPPARLGNRMVGSVPAQQFDCADGRMTVQAGQDDHFQRLCKVLGRQDLATDPRYRERAGRVAHEAALVAELEREFEKWPLAEIYGACVAADIIVAPIYSVDQTFSDPHVIARGMVVEAVSPEAGPVRMIANPIRFSRTPIDEYRMPPDLGQDTDEILTQRLGFDSARIADLRARGVI